MKEMTLEDKSEILDMIVGESVRTASIFGGTKVPQQVTLMFESGKILSIVTNEDDSSKLELIFTA